jgi:excisionase family DNA binding protein
MAVKEVEGLFPVARSTLYEALRAGQIPGIRVGARWFIPTAAVRRLLLLDEDG